MTNIIEGLIDEKSMKKQIEERLRRILDALSKVKEGWSKAKEGWSELGEALQKDDLSFLCILLGDTFSEAEISEALQRRGLLDDAGESVPPPSYETATAVLATPSPMPEEHKAKKRGKPIKDLFRDESVSAKWLRLCKEFFAPILNVEIDSSVSNRVLQRFAWFLSVWLEADLLVTQIFSPAIRFLKSLGFRLVIDFQTCNNVLRKIFARREEYQDAKSEVLAFCMANA
jgi:hypothetical protein